MKTYNNHRIDGKGYKGNLDRAIIFVLAEIKKENDLRVDRPISTDDSNEFIDGIMKRANDKYDVDFIDMECRLAEIVGQNALDKIRDAEQGIYN